ncbi:MAG: FkbM family methyltransferase [Bacteroidetes bacterium]|nr:FkbM family methyltransferase [Bacteroidota bacterium]
MEFDIEFLTISSNVPPGSVIVDVGSNIGLFSDIFLEHGYKVISIDPLPSSIERQKQRFEKYLHDKQIHLHQVACSNKRGTATLHLSSDANRGCSSLEDRWLKEIFISLASNNVINVKTVRLSDLLQQYIEIGLRPSCVKIDTEGHEQQVLLGLFQGLSPEYYPMIIMFEFNTHLSNISVLEGCLSLLTGHDYHEYKYIIRHGDILLHESDWTNNSFDVHQWDGWQGIVKAGFRYGNVLARRG